MHNLDPAISRLQEHAARLAMAVGTVRYLGDATTIENEATVSTAIHVLSKLDRELNDTLTALVDLGSGLEALTEEPLEIRIDPDDAYVSPSPDRTSLEVDLGEVRITVPAGRAVDELVKSLEDNRAHTRLPETAPTRATAVPTPR
ncbi:hypothetical protein F4561_001111 [Lipingzhangella halophila]|uniref:Uncharacterized protein n=1 Tax=Lipingzhangella halophila TaxID=1783352 RepID=A0A7W7RE38_9ACTN|nr:hypothetical protein [Lipingzhangella halophila]MBB4930291.1 hypothetical protein [Lipingzhangella halophila]